MVNAETLRNLQPPPTHPNSPRELAPNQLQIAQQISQIASQIEAQNTPKNSPSSQKPENKQETRQPEIRTPETLKASEERARPIEQPKNLTSQTIPERQPAQEVQNSGQSQKQTETIQKEKAPELRKEEATPTKATAKTESDHVAKEPTKSTRDSQPEIATKVSTAEIKEKPAPLPKESPREPSQPKAEVQPSTQKQVPEPTIQTRAESKAPPRSENIDRPAQISQPPAPAPQASSQASPQPRAPQSTVTPPQQIQERIANLGRTTPREIIPTPQPMVTATPRIETRLSTHQQRERAAETIRLFNQKQTEETSHPRAKIEPAGSIARPSLADLVERERIPRATTKSELPEKQAREIPVSSEAQQTLLNRNSVGRENNQVLSIGRQGSDGDSNSSSGHRREKAGTETAQHTKSIVEQSVSSPTMLELRQVIATLEGAPKETALNPQVSEQLRALLNEIGQIIDARLLDQSRPLSPQELESLIPYDRIRKLLSEAMSELNMRERLKQLDDLYEQLMGEGADKDTPLQDLAKEITDILKDVLQIQKGTPGVIPPEVLAALGYGIKEQHELDEEEELELEHEEELDTEGEDLSEQCDLEFIEEDRDIAVYEIHGCITDIKSGRPIAGVVLYGGLLGTTRTDSQGFYTFSNIPRGTVYIIGPDKDGYEFNPVSVSGTISQHARHDFRGRKL